MQHRSGLANKILWVDTPSEISKWREERKKNYPTDENVAKKKQVEMEKLARGEVLSNVQFTRSFIKKDRGKRFHSNNRRNRHPNSYDNSQSQIPKEDIKKETSTDPLCLCLEDAGDEPLEIQVPAVDNSADQLGGALGSLVSSYGDRSGSEDDSSSILQLAKSGIGPDRRQKRNIDQPWITQELKELVKDKWKLLEVAKVSDKTEDWLAYKKSRNIVNAALRSARRIHLGEDYRGNRQSNKKNNKSGFMQGGSLLEKLLQPEIRKERNVILQCIRYCITNNFFGVLENVKIQSADSVPVEKDLYETEEHVKTRSADSVPFEKELYEINTEKTLL